MPVNNISFFLWIVLFFSALTSVFCPATLHASWTQQIVDSSVETQNMSLDIDNNGFIHVSYYDATNTDLRYAFFNGTGWSIKTLDSTGHTGAYTSLQVNSQGYASVAYRDLSNPYLKLASFNGTSWNLQVVNENTYAQSISLALDSQGYAKISSWDTGPYNTDYTAFNGTGWSTTTLLAHDALAGTSIALNADGYARISYLEGPTLTYASFNGTNWNKQYLTQGIEYIDYVSLALDSQGYGHISYYDTGRQRLGYAFFNGTGWDTQIVDNVGTVGLYSSLALDSQGYAYISYIEDTGTAYNIKLAHWTGITWEIQTLATNIQTTGGAPTDRSLTLFNDYLYITYAQQGGDLAIMTNAPQGLVSEPTVNTLGKILFFFLPLFVVFTRKKS